MIRKPTISRERKIGGIRGGRKGHCTVGAQNSIYMGIMNITRQEGRGLGEEDRIFQGGGGSEGRKMKMGQGSFKERKADLGRKNKER